MSEPNNLTAFPKNADFDTKGAFSMVNRPLGAARRFIGSFGGKNAATDTLGTGRGIVGVQLAATWRSDPAGMAKRWGKQL